MLKERLTYYKLRIKVALMKGINKFLWRTIDTITKQDIQDMGKISSEE